VGAVAWVPRYRAMAEINMTPFIDVILVLLIIFMVAAPLLATGVAIDLPKTKAAALNVEQKPISVAVDDKAWSMSWISRCKSQISRTS